MTNTKFDLGLCGVFLLIAVICKDAQHYLWAPRLIRFHGADLFIFPGLVSIQYLLLRKFRNYAKNCVTPAKIKANLGFYAPYFAVLFSLMEIFPGSIGHMIGNGKCDPVDLVCYLIGGLTGVALVVRIPDKELEFRVKEQVPEVHPVIA